MCSKVDAFVKSQNLAQRRKARKVKLLILKDIFLAFLASLRENILFTRPSRLLQLSQDSVIEAYNLAIEKGYLEKASWLETFIDEEDMFYATETRETRPNLVREKTMRLARPSRHQIGA